jgi:hypothetical protein
MTVYEERARKCPLIHDLRTGFKLNHSRAKLNILELSGSSMNCKASTFLRLSLADTGFMNFGNCDQLPRLLKQEECIHTNFCPDLTSQK